MTDLSLISRLAELKSIIKELDSEAKLIQKQLIEEGAGDKIKTRYGTLTLTTRTNYVCTDKKQVYSYMGMDDYVAASSITLPAITKVRGTAMSDELLSQGVYRVKSESKYYTLRG